MYIHLHLYNLGLIQYRGASLAYRVALWYPDLVSHVFTVCVPYASPTPRFATIAEIVARAAPHFAYQLQFISGEVERAFTSREQIKAFLNTLYGGRTPKKEVAFDVEKGVLMDRVFDVQRSKLLSEEVFSPSLGASGSVIVS